MSMKVERSTVDQVRARFESNKRKKEEDEKNQVRSFKIQVFKSFDRKKSLRLIFLKKIRRILYISSEFI